MKWKVYILWLSDGSLYTGITNNLQKRLEAHGTKKGSKYVASRLPIKTVFILEEHDTRSKALKREAEIKKLTRKQKLELINADIT